MNLTEDLQMENAAKVIFIFKPWKIGSAIFLTKNIPKYMMDFSFVVISFNKNKVFG